MGWLFGGKSESIPVDELSDKQIKEALKKGKVPNISPKDLKKMNKDAQRAALGEKGFAAVTAAAKDIVNRDAAKVRKAVDERENARMKSQRPSDFRIKGRGAIPLKDTMHPAAYKHLLEKEAKRQGLI
ncbi:MAG: hypothetical protein ABW007_27660 [Chitinophagaceae bacterium]